MSVHCLANGGCELIEYYAKKAGGEPFTSHIMETHLDLKNDLKRLRPSAQVLDRLQARHAPTQRPRTRRRRSAGHFYDEKNDHALFIGWYDYALATQTMPIEAQIHQVWYLALQPMKLNDKHSPEPYEAMFPDLRSKHRAEQKQMLNAVIERTRANKEIMSDPRTDTRSLMLGWALR